MVPFQALTALGHSVHGVCPGKKATPRRGRRVSAYGACAPEVRLAGGEYVETPPDGAIRDGNLVSGFAWPAHPQFLALFLEVLGTRVSL
jgi:putative intracellular protease/amidase